MPVTLVTLSAVSLDGAEHDVRVKLHLSDRLCYDGAVSYTHLDVYKRQN